MAVLGDEPSRFLYEHAQKEVIIKKCLIQRDRHTVEPYDFFDARSAVDASVDASTRGRRRETDAATAVRVRRTKARRANAFEAHRGRARDARAEVGLSLIHI